jgi:hypothetical protein
MGEVTKSKVGGMVTPMSHRVTYALQYTIVRSPSISSLTEFALRITSDVISSHSMDQFLDTEKTPAIRQLLEQYSRNKTLGNHSMENAFRLACGRLPLIILLQEPCKAADVVPYGKMVTAHEGGGERNRYTAGSPTLREIENTICAISEGKISLQDVSLIDINMLCSPSIQERDDFVDKDLVEAQTLCLQIIKLVQPKVLLILTCVAHRSIVKGIRLFSSSLAEAGTRKRKSVGTGDDCHAFSVIKGFHPSVFLRKDYINRRQWGEKQVCCAREMLHWCFQKAMLELWDEECHDQNHALQLEWTKQCREVHGLHRVNR